MVGITNDSIHMAKDGVWVSWGYVEVSSDSILGSLYGVCATQNYILGSPELVSITLDIVPSSGNWVLWTDHSVISTDNLVSITSDCVFSTCDGI